MGEFLFKYRGQIPVLLFLLVIPFIYCTDYSSFSLETIQKNTITSFLISFFGLIIRFYTVGTTPAGTSGRNRKKQIAKKLNKKGIYSTIRNPLYLGNYLIWLGISIYTLNTAFTIVISLFFYIHYNQIIETEEKYLTKKFKKEFLLWKSITPKFFPTLKNYKALNYPFSIKTVLKREYSSVLSTILSFFYVQVVINFFSENQLISNQMMIILFITISIILILRTIKKNTNLLNQVGRT